MKHIATFICLALLASFTFGCKAKDNGTTKGKASGKHAHRAPNGGVLVELEDHVANLEFTFDTETGTLGVLCLGGHASKGLVPKGEFLFVDVKAGDQTISVKLSGVANSLTGETKDVTSQFQGSDPKLKSLTKFTGTLKSVTLKGKEYKNVSFSFPNK
ncbi:MAG: hypothetical protein P1V97_13870 [Planctomycetota bacterium]|nr:hypothetical protein [Planctomycetota bacterium]